MNHRSTVPLTCALASVAALALTLAASGSAAAPGTPTWRFDYGIGLHGTVGVPALTNASSIGIGSDGRIQIAFPDRVDEVTAVGESSRSLPVAPTAVTADGAHDYIARTGTAGVQVYPANGSTPSATLGAGRPASAIAVDGADPVWGGEVIWVGDSAAARITGYTPGGDTVTSFASHTPHITALATLPDGTVLVLDGPSGIVQRLTPQGVPIGRFGSTGSADGQMSDPQGIAADSSGTVFVADTGNGRIDLFDAQGHDAGQFGAQVYFQPGEDPTYGPGEFSAPHSVVVDCTGRLHVLDVAPPSSLDPNPEGRVAVFTGVAAPTGSCYGPRTDGFTGPKNGVVAVDRAGDYYVASGSTVSKYTATGSPVTSWSSPPKGAGQWSHPSAIAVSPSGEVYLVDSDAKTVLEFHAAGTFVRSWTGGDGFTPVSVVVRPADGHVFVGYLTHAVEEFTATGTPVGTVKLAPIGAQAALPWYLGMAGNTLLATVQQQTFPYEFAVERFDGSSTYVGQFRGPGRTVEDDYLVGVAPYAGGGYAVDAIPSTGNDFIDATAGGVVRVSSSGAVLGRLAEPDLPSGTAPSGGLTTDCAGRIIGADASTGRIFRLRTSSAVCRWLPTATTGAVTSATTTSLVVKAAANPSAQVTKVRVQYGATTSYGHATAWVTLPSDNVAISRAITVSGLAHAHRYHYRVQAMNASGTVAGHDATGTTR